MVCFVRRRPRFARTQLFLDNISVVVVVVAIAHVVGHFYGDLVVQDGQNVRCERFG